MDSAPAYTAELQLAIRLARDAGEIVKTFYHVPPIVRWKDPTEPVTEADRAVDAYLVRQLTRALPDDGVLAEESKDDLTRLRKRRVWLVDPIDGTVEFIARNEEFCIMIGLAVNGEPAVGVVFQPVADVLYAAAIGMGAFVEELGERRSLHVSRSADISRFRLVVSRSHRVALTDTIMARLGVRKERRVGSVGLKIGLITRGQADFYVHPNPGTKEWDTCAPNIILREAGGIMTDCWNRPLRYNQEDSVHHFGLVASNGTQHELLTRLVAQVLDEAGFDSEFGF